MEYLIQELRDSAKSQPCTLNVSGVCRGGTSTTVLCHLPTEWRGTALKSPDIAAVYGCDRCHQWLDSSRGNEGERAKYMLRALIRTHQRMYDHGVIRCGRQDRVRAMPAHAP